MIYDRFIGLSQIRGKFYSKTPDSFIYLNMTNYFFDGVPNFFFQIYINMTIPSTVSKKIFFYFHSRLNDEKFLQERIRLVHLCR